MEVFCPPDLDIAAIQAECGVPQSIRCDIGPVKDAKTVLTRPEQGSAHVLGDNAHTMIWIEGTLTKIILDSGAACSVVDERALDKLLKRDWRSKLLPMSKCKLGGVGGKLCPIGVLELQIISPHQQKSVRLTCEFVVVTT